MNRKLKDCLVNVPYIGKGTYNELEQITEIERDTKVCN